MSRLTMSEPEPSTELIGVRDEITWEMDKGKESGKSVYSIEVSEKQWNVLMTHLDFRREAERGRANLGGYRVVKGNGLKINYEEFYPAYKKSIKAI
jgi:hypothetical protein